MAATILDIPHRSLPARYRRPDAPSMPYTGRYPIESAELLLPCSHCGQRMEITAVAPARYTNSAESNDLEDVTHTCVQCGATLIRTRRPLTGDAHAIACRV
jgi:hypothetical protein